MILERVRRSWCHRKVNDNNFSQNLLDYKASMSWCISTVIWLMELTYPTFKKNIVDKNSHQIVTGKKELFKAAFIHEICMN